MKSWIKTDVMIICPAVHKEIKYLKLKTYFSCFCFYNGRFQMKNEKKNYFS
jgi:hypothetical protein